MESKVILTTDSGAPVTDNQNSRTAGPAGPVLIEDHHLIEKLAHFDRERIPERVVHAKGSGAYGYFEVLANVTQWTKAKLSGPGGKTNRSIHALLYRGGGERLSRHGARSAGLCDQVLHRGRKLRPGRQQHAGLLYPRSAQIPRLHPLAEARPLHQYPGARQHLGLFLAESRGYASVHDSVQRSRHPRQLSQHGRLRVAHLSMGQCARRSILGEVSLQDRSGDQECLTAEDAARIAGHDADYHQRDLLRAIDRAEYPSWTLKMQIMPAADAAKYRFNPFDVTKVWPHRDYPLMTIGRIVLNRNPENYFAEVEQAAFNPAHFVPGIGPSPDKMLQGRLFAYGDTHRYRLGANHMHLPVNRPHAAEVAQLRP